jgi:hypothetical protein
MPGLALYPSIQTMTLLPLMVRPSEDRGINLKIKNLHFISSWAAGNRLMLGQVKNQEKSNEIEAIPRLSKILDIRHTIVTIDAMGCQKEIPNKSLNRRLIMFCL